MRDEGRVMLATCFVDVFTYLLPVYYLFIAYLLPMYYLLMAY